MHLRSTSGAIIQYQVRVIYINAFILNRMLLENAGFDKRQMTRTLEIMFCLFFDVKGLLGNIRSKNTKQFSQVLIAHQSVISKHAHSTGLTAFDKWWNTHLVIAYNLIWVLSKHNIYSLIPASYVYAGPRQCLKSILYRAPPAHDLAEDSGILHTPPELLL